METGVENFKAGLDDVTKFQFLNISAEMLIITVALHKSGFYRRRKHTIYMKKALIKQKVFKK